ncbi:MAG TPA: glycosyltransferase family 2 protein [Rhizomicrobium sp.]|jgi:cellulose synthase/poly-beta-1,6-N-acetylglucosamine synthase-like glycosyltransferase
MMVLPFLVATVDAITALALLGVIAVGLGFLMLPALYLFEWAQGRRDRANPALPPPHEHDAPTVLIQLPIYNEPTEVIEGLLLSVSALAWPKTRLHLQLLDDSEPPQRDAAQILVARLRTKGFRADHIVRDSRDGYKAGALAAGLRASEAPFVALLDADFRPPANWLACTVPVLAADAAAGFIQSRCEFSNSQTNWLTRAQSLLFDSHFVMEQAVRARAGMLFQFNGTGGIWRRRAIEEAGGWTGDSLCEDLDLTIRAALAGWKGLFSMEPPVSGLVPERMRDWRVQQRRWASGFAQIARKLSLPLWRSRWPLAKKLQAGFLILYQAALPVIAVATVALALDVLLRGLQLPPLAPLFDAILILFVPVVAGMTLPSYLELKRGGAVRYLLAVCSLPPLILYLSIANARPIVAAFFGRSEVFKRTPKPVPGL